MNLATERATVTVDPSGAWAAPSSRRPSRPRATTSAPQRCSDGGRPERSTTPTAETHLRRRASSGELGVQAVVSIGVGRRIMVVMLWPGGLGHADGGR